MALVVRNTKPVILLDIRRPPMIIAFREHLLRKAEAVGYEGWASAEMCPTYKLYTDQMIYNASAAMDCILRRK